MTENEKKVLANVEDMVSWLEDYQKKTFGVSGDLTGRNQDLANYFSDFHGEFNNFERAADENELLDEIKNSQIIFLGDFHNLRQSQKFTARLIEKLSFCDAFSKTLAVEFISPDCQKILDAYQFGQVSEETFLKKIHFKNWNNLDHWEGYKAILTTAKKHHIKVSGIRPYPGSGHLAGRDQLFAQDLKMIAGAYPADQLIVSIGNAHLVKNHLPEKMLALPEFSGKRVIRVIANLSRIYFSALRRYENFNLPRILKISKGVYHVMIAPVITQLLSNIENLEYATKKDAFENIWTEGDLVLEIVRRWASLLELKFDPERLPEFYFENQKEFRLKKVLEELARLVFGPPLLKWTNDGESFLYFCSKLFIPERRPESETEQVGEKMFIDFLKGRKPVIPGT